MCMIAPRAVGLDHLRGGFTPTTEHRRSVDVDNGLPSCELHLALDDFRRSFALNPSGHSRRMPRYH